MNRIVRRSIVAIVLAIGIVCAGSASARSHHHHHKQTNSSGHFDYYLMSLSWSPSYCATHPRDTTQCGHQGFGFVLHGLWPQYRNGSWPQHCATQATPDEATDQARVAIHAQPSSHRTRMANPWLVHRA